MGAVGIRVNHGLQGFPVGRSDILGNAQLGIIFYLHTVIAIGLKLIIQRGRHVQHINNHGADGRHACVINSR
ncbi:hypothetical protein D9M69_638310 [compost metagenome]